MKTRFTKAPSGAAPPGPGQEQDQSKDANIKELNERVKPIIHRSHFHQNRIGHLLHFKGRRFKELSELKGRSLLHLINVFNLFSFSCLTDLLFFFAGFALKKKK